MQKYLDIVFKVAIASAVAFLVYSCKGKLSETDGSMENVPIQSVEQMNVIQNENTLLKMRLEAPRMNRYEKEGVSWEEFPEGLMVYTYNESEELESLIVSDHATHDTKQKRSSDVWKAYGNVVIRNLINGQVIKTDTLYWDREGEKIWTDCYVQIISPDGFLQGYGMESDQKAKHSMIRKPFDAYGYIQKDSTKVERDTVNFIGPMKKN